MQKQLFLTSSVHAVASDIATKLDLSIKNKLIFINTPAEPEMDVDISWLENDRSALVEAGFSVTDYSITGKNSSQIIEDLSPFEYIYMSGGNTLYLLEQSQKTGFIPIIRDFILKKGKTYIGTSAGSIIAGPKPYDYMWYETSEKDLMDAKGYNLVNFLIVPHWGSELFRDYYLNKRIKTAYKEDQLPLILLTDNQYVHVKGDTMKIFNVSN